MDNNIDILKTLINKGITTQKKIEEQLKIHNNQRKKYGVIHNYDFKVLKFTVLHQFNFSNRKKKKLTKKEKQIFSCSDFKNDEKLDQSLSRTKSKVYEYAMCNEFDYFINLTLDQTKINRYNLKDYIKQLGAFIHSYSRKYGSKIKYLFVPEQHKDGAWHIHGLITGILPQHITPNKNGYLHFDLYAIEFGYNSLSAIKSREKTACYITKYLSKDLAQRKNELNAKLFYSSHGLNKKITEKKGQFSGKIEPTFENDICQIQYILPVELEKYKNMIKEKQENTFG